MHEAFMPIFSLEKITHQVEKLIICTLELDSSHFSTDYCHTGAKKLDIRPPATFCGPEVVVRFHSIPSLRKHGILCAHHSYVDSHYLDALQHFSISPR